MDDGSYRIIMTNKTVAIFGVFDGVHDGHSSFISEAKKEGDRLVAIVARDSIVEKLKGKAPKHNEVDRINALLEVKDIDTVLLGDPDLGTYNILKEVKPDVVFLGYDQTDLSRDINLSIRKGNLPEMEIIHGTPHKPEIFHSSILNTNK